MVKKALSIILKDKMANGKVVVLQGLQELPISTKELNAKLVSNEIVNPLVAYGEIVDNFNKSIRNIKGVKLLNSSALNVYDLINHDFLLLDEGSYEKVKNDVL